MMQTMFDAAGDSPIRNVRAVLRGEVIEPADAAYDDARTVFYSGFSGRPALIVRPFDTGDVARTVLLARERDVPLAIRSGGHSVAGHSVCDGGIVLDLSSMHALDIDVATRTAWAETGLTAGAYTTTAGAHGLATGFGDSPSVGIGGLTLGGGMGFLHRRYGLTIDSVLGADVVTADGRLLHTDAETHPDLFWAIRGGGGNFGVVTRLRYRLFDVDQVMGGMMVIPATPELIVAFLGAAAAAPDALSGMINIMPAPPMPGFPSELHGRLVLMAMLVHSGSLTEAERSFAALRALGTPAIDAIRPMAYRDIYAAGEDAPHPVAITVRSFFTDSVGADDAERIVDGLTAGTAPMRVVQFRILGGAVARVPADGTAFAHRDRAVHAAVAAAFNDPQEAAQHDAWASGLAGRLQQGAPGAYVGFLGNEGPDRVREAYPDPVWQRLRAVKAQYDPGNVFRLNQNIPPA